MDANRRRVEVGQPRSQSQWQECRPELGDRLGVTDVDEPAGDVRGPESAFPEPAAPHHARRAALVVSIVGAAGYGGEIWIKPRVGPELRQDLDEAGLAAEEAA